MKHAALLGVCALLTGSVSVAQNNTATSTQKGTNQTVTIKQQGKTLLSTVSQAGTVAGNVANTATITQAGLSHVATVNQNDNSQYNTATIKQDGASANPNTATINQNASGGTSATGNTATVTQTGSANRATTDQNAGAKNGSSQTLQYGSGNTATVDQSGSTNASSVVDQGFNLFGANQKGTNNNATVNQSGSTGNQSFVGQLTSGNTATVLQSGNQSSGNVAYIQQNSTNGIVAVGTGNNRAIIQQETNTPEPPSTGSNTSFSSNNMAFITQLGDNSYADIKQRKDADRNYAEINQYSGTGSDARIQQEYQATSSNSAIINQYGDRQTAYAAQIKASDNQTSINQGSAGGSDNKAYSYQSFSTNSRVGITQNQMTGGSNNFAEVAQGYYLGDPDRTNGNLASVQQEGSRNQARLIQTGAGIGMGNNTATFSQFGNNNVVGGTARIPNPVDTYNQDTFNAAIQNGGLNQMTVTQNSPGGANTTIFNTANLSQVGTSNALTLTQNAVTVGNVATINQTGMMNQALVRQSGMTP